MIPGEVRYLVGLIGAEISTSLSPQLHEREADELGLKYFYQLIDIEQLGLNAEAAGPLLSEARRMGFRGLNITHPCKQVVVPYLDGLSPAAAALTAVNTVEFADGKMIGHNTDSSGFEAAFTRGLPQVPLRHVAILGAGGAELPLPMPSCGWERSGTIAEGALRPCLRSRRHPAQRVRAGLGTGQLTPAIWPTEMRRSPTGWSTRPPLGWESQTGMPLPEELLRAGDVGCGHRLPAAGDGTAGPCPCPWLPNAAGKRHAGLPGGRGLPPVHRAATRCRADVRPSGVPYRARRPLPWARRRSPTVRSRRGPPCPRAVRRARGAARRRARAHTAVYRDHLAERPAGGEADGGGPGGFRRRRDVRGRPHRLPTLTG